MVRNLIFVSPILFSLNALASEVKITSFRYLEAGVRNSSAAELCGKLVSPTGQPELVNIVSDPNSKTPAPYTAWTNKDGKFCLVISTLTGRANVDLE